MSTGRLLARTVIGGLFIAHGGQKLFGWFGGPGPKGTEAMMESLELRPPRLQAITAGVTEAGGGALLAAGLATPLASAALTGVMTTAIKKVHLANGPWAANGGWEYNVVMIAALTVLAESGPGDLSLDRALGTERSGPGWAMAALATGVATAAATMILGKRVDGGGAGPAGGGAGAGGDEGRAGQAAQGETAGDPTTSGA